MICKHANGVCICGKNNYCSIKPMTNEEWLNSLSTEEKSTFIAMFTLRRKFVDIGEFYESVKESLINAANGEENQKKKVILMKREIIVYYLLKMLKLFSRIHKKFLELGIEYMNFMNINKNQL